MNGHILTDEEYLERRQQRLEREAQEQIEYDAAGLFCPSCGCSAVEITRLPKLNDWWGREGRATCGHCGAVFRVKVQEE